MVHRIRTIDAHTAGEPLRLIVDGYPAPKGRTMLDRREWLRANHDDLRSALMLEPRGHTDMYGALLTPPVSAEADAGVLFMHNQGYSTMCGHGVIAVVKIAIERSLIVTPRLPAITLDTPAGLVRAMATVRPATVPPVVDAVSFINVPSFVLLAGLPVSIGGRTVRADVAFGGAFYAIVDSEAVGIPITPRRLPDLRRIGMEIGREIERSHDVVHPLEPGLYGIYGTVFTGPPSREDADLRNVTVFADAEVDRSPCGTGTCAVMAVLSAMELLPDGHRFGHESLIGTLFEGKVAGRTTVGDLPAVVPEISGSASITGEHTFLLDDEDPLREGFRI